MSPGAIWRALATERGNSVEKQ
ncbi:hypothetical protein A2U01_0090618, partial [Trifolium medium]|nr:hypothetical protein [Trifolium medium]